LACTTVRGAFRYRPTLMLALSIGERSTLDPIANRPAARRRGPCAFLSRGPPSTSREIHSRAAASSKGWAGRSAAPTLLSGGCLVWSAIARSAADVGSMASGGVEPKLQAVGVMETE
jgi:hypothetical protein